MSGSTRERLLRATLRVLAEEGIAKASARTIASAADANPALVFYHFGSVDELLAAACRYGAEQRVAAHRRLLREVGSFSELVTAARHIHETERQEGSVAQLGQLLAGVRSHPELAAATAEGLQLWVVEIEAVLHRLLGRTPLAGAVDVPGLARAVSASFVGLELYEGADPDGAGQAFDALESLAGVLAVLEELGPLETRLLRRRLPRT